MDIKFVTVQRKHLKRLNEIVNDEDVARYLTMTPPVSLKSTIEWYNVSRAKKNFWWAIVHKGKIAGSVEVMREGSGTREGKLGHATGLGIAIDKPYWNLGLGKIAVKYAMKKAREHGFKRLDLWVVRENIWARRLYKKCGFKEEGALKKYFRLNGKYHDAIMMAKLF